MTIVMQNIQLQTQQDWRICYLQVKTILKKNLREEEIRFQFDILNLKTSRFVYNENNRNLERKTDTIRSIHIVRQYIIHYITIQ